MLPDGKSVLYTAYSNAAHTLGAKIMVQSLKAGEPKELFAGYGARYLPTGHIVYWLANTKNVSAIRFDLDRLEVTGGAVPVVEGITSFAVSNGGTLVYTLQTSSEAPFPASTLVWVDREGKEEPIAAPPKIYSYPKVSPDGTRVALTISIGGKPNIWTWNLVRKTLTRLTFGEKGDIQSIWTPDGKRIVFCSDIIGASTLC